MNKLTMIALGVVILCLSAFGVYQATKDPVDIQPLSAYFVGEMKDLELFTPAKPLSDHIIQRGDGSPVKLSALKGRVLLVNFWASWCAPCQAEMKELEHLQSLLGDDEFAVIAVNVDRSGGYKMAQEVLQDEWGVKGLDIYADPTMDTAIDIAGGALPTSLIVDKDGQIRAQYLGPLKWDAPEAIALFKAMKEEKI